MAASYELVAEPLERLRALALSRAVELDEAKEEWKVGDAANHAREVALVELALALELAPEAVRAIVELDGGQDALVVGELLGEPACAHRVVVLADSRQPLADFRLEGV